MKLQRQAARLYDVDDRTIRKWADARPWEKEGSNLDNLTAHSGMSPVYGELEQELMDWVLEQRRDGLGMQYIPCQNV